MVPLMGTHRSYSITLGDDSPLKCVPTTLYARKHSEMDSGRKFGNNFSPKSLVNDARREAAQLDSVHGQIHPKLKSSFGKLNPFSIEQIVDIAINKEAFGIPFYNPRNLIPNPKNK